jgi:hypothetical protein
MTSFFKGAERASKESTVLFVVLCFPFERLSALLFNERESAQGAVRRFYGCFISIKSVLID